MKLKPSNLDKICNWTTQKVELLDIVNTSYQHDYSDYNIGLIQGLHPSTTYHS